MSADQPLTGDAHDKWRRERAEAGWWRTKEEIAMTDPQPLTGDELATIKTRAAKAGQAWVHDPYGHLTTLVGYDVPRLVAEIERLQALEAEVRSLPALWPLLDTFTP